MLPGLFVVGTVVGVLAVLAGFGPAGGATGWHRWLNVGLVLLSIAVSIHAGRHGRHGWATGIVVLACAVGFGATYVPVGAAFWLLVHLGRTLEARTSRS